MGGYAYLLFSIFNVLWKFNYKDVDTWHNDKVPHMNIRRPPQKKVRRTPKRGLSDDVAKEVLKEMERDLQ